MKRTLKALKDNSESKTFKFEIFFSYPFDKAIIMTPFPMHFEIPKFDKYKGWGDPVTHIKVFYMYFQEVAYSVIFLMHLFPKILGGPSLEWFYQISYDMIQIFSNLSKAFVVQYAHLLKTKLIVLT